MAKLGTVQNGLKKASNGTKKKSNPLTLARAKGFAKKNGFKIVPKGTTLKAAPNPKHKKKGKKKKNGLSASRGGFSLSRRNGLLGNTTKQVKDVGALLAGLLGGKAAGRFLQSFIAPYLAKTGLGQYVEILSDGAIALVVAPMVAAKVAGADAAKFASLGAMANVVVDIIDMVAPNALSMFGGNPLVSNGQQVGLSPAAVTALVASTNATPQQKAQVAGAMAQLNAGNLPSIGYDDTPFSSRSVMPLYG